MHDRIQEFFINEVPNRKINVFNKNDSLKIIYGNTRSLNSSGRKKTYLRNEAHAYGADIIIISESGFAEGAQAFIDGYNNCGNSPKPMGASQHTGGVAAWIHKNSNTKILYKDCYNHIKGLQTVKLVLENNVKILGFYRSPNQSKEELVQTQEFFKKIEDDTILIGDLNIPETDWTRNEICNKKKCNDRREKEELIAILTTDSNRKQSVNFATNKHNNNILDVMIHPLESEILEIKEAESPDTYKDEPGTDHKWLKI